MSTTTAERLLHSHRPSAPRGLSMTQAGPLLKHQIPIRTFHGWDNAQPGFLEADLVAHNGGNSEGCSLYTLTLTDVATGWTECLPVLYKTAEAVLAAFRQARALFPFPILGLDTDNGGEFINETLMQYCEAEQITFTRGRPELKDDQCFVEQKTGVVPSPHFQLPQGRLLLISCIFPSNTVCRKHVRPERGGQPQRLCSKSSKINYLMR